MNFRPLRARCLVLLDPQETKMETTLDIELPDLCRMQPETGEVIAVGNECEHVKVGDRVQFGKFNGTDVTEALSREPWFVEGRQYYVMRPVDAKLAVADHIYLVLDQ